MPTTWSENRDGAASTHRPSRPFPIGGSPPPPQLRRRPSTEFDPRPCAPSPPATDRWLHLRHRRNRGELEPTDREPPRSPIPASTPYLRATRQPERPASRRHPSPLENLTPATTSTRLRSQRPNAHSGLLPIHRCDRHEHD